jgi:hypothetical protein
MIIEDKLTNITNAMFRYPSQWVYVTDEQKEKWFFIINRYLSKNYPEKAFYLNDKIIDKVLAMNIWQAFMLDKPFPDMFWSKSEKKSEKILSSHKSLLFLQNEILNITEAEMEILLCYHNDEVQEELKYIKKQTGND